ncbi:DNA helicase ATP, partial [Brachionus plicatilis]
IILQAGDKNLLAEKKNLLAEEITSNIDCKNIILFVLMLLNEIVFVQTSMIFAQFLTHMNGRVNLKKKSQEKLKGTFGMIYEPDQTNNNMDTKKLKEALIWLKENNSLYKDAIANFERLDGFVTNTTSSYEGFPLTSSSVIKYNDTGILLQPNNPTDTGLIINMDPKKTRQQVGKVVGNIGYTIQKDSKNNYNKIDVKATDDSIEPKIFPHLFPDGKGYYIRNKTVSLAQYFRNRLLHVDSRWRDDHSHVKGSQPSIQLLSQDRLWRIKGMLKVYLKNDYFEYGNCVPRCITGSKAYWKSKNYDLVSMVNNKGLPALFLTLTANDSWCELKSILSGKKKTAAIFNPIEVLMKEIKSDNGLLGKVENYWTRIECQNRGSLHAHILLWIKNVKKDLVCAEIPNCSDDVSFNVRNLVKKYQIHRCVDRRCFRNNKRFFKKCKYGFSFEICENDYIDGNSKYFYKRKKNEDRDVVPNNPELLMLWNGHVNLQYCTKRGIEQYLVKYISKVEPSFKGKEMKSESNQVKNYFDLRIVSSVEAAAFVLGHHFVQSNMKVTFIPTSLPGDEFKFLKKREELIEMDPEDQDIFKKSALDYYLKRPKGAITDSLTIFEFHQKFQVYVKNSKTKVPISRSDKLLFDEDRNKVVKRKNDIIIRTNFFDETDGEIYFYQKLIYNISFRSVDELIKECFIRNLIKRPDDSDPDIDYLTYSNLKDPINILDLNSVFNRNFIAENFDPIRFEDHIFNDPKIYCDNVKSVNQDDNSK